MLGFAAVAAVVVVWLASKSVAIPIALAGAPDIVIGIKGSDPFPSKFSIYFTVGWTLIAIFIALLRDEDAFPLRLLASGPVVLSFLLLALMVARLGDSLAPSYGSYKLQLFVAKGVVSLLAGIFIARRRKDFDLFLLLFMLSATVSGLVLMKQILQGTANANLGGRLALFADANPIELGRWAALGLILGVYLIVASGPTWRRMAATVAVPVLAVALLAAGSRGPTLGLVVGLVVLIGLMLDNPAVRRRLVLVAAGAVGAALLVPAVVPGQDVTRSLSVLFGGGTTAEGGLDPNGRFSLFGEAWHAFAAHPFLGIGTGSFLGAYGDLYPHNLVLEAAAEYGIAGALLLVGILVLAVRGPLRVFRAAEGESRSRAALVLAVLAWAIVNSCVSGAFENSLVLFLATGLGVGLAQSPGEPSERKRFSLRGRRDTEAPATPSVPPRPSSPRGSNGAVFSPAPGSVVGGRVRVAAKPAQTGWNVSSLLVECSVDGRAWVEIGTAEGEEAYDVYLVSRGASVRRRHVAVVRSQERAEQLRSTLEAEHAGGPERVEIAPSRRRPWSTEEPHAALWDTTQVGDGLWRLRAVTVDVAGRRVTSPEVTVTVDNTPPMVSIESPAANAVVIEPTQIKVTARDASSEVTEVRFEYSGGVEWVGIAAVSAPPHTALWDAAALPEGDYRLRAVAVDAGGNEGSSRSVPVRVERVDPAIVLEEVAPILTGLVELRARVRAEQAVEWVEFQAAPTESFDWRALARLERPPFAVTLDTASLPDGSYELRALTGQQGRVDASRPVRGRKIDNTPPWIALREPRADSWVREEVVITARASDEGSGLKSVLFQFSADGRNWRPVVPEGAPSGPGSALWDTSGLEDGDYFLRAVAGDAAGNLGASDPVRVQLDRTPPAAELRQPATGSALSGIVTLVAEAHDAGSGVIGLRFQCSQDGQSWWELASVTVPPYTAPWDTRTVADGPYKLRCVARDRVGNSAFGVPVEIAVANQAAEPPVRVSGPVEGAWGNREVPPTHREVPPGPALEPEPEPALPALEAATLWQLEGLLAERGAADPRREERVALLYELRKVAKPDGSIPDRFWGLLWETFGDLFEP